MIATLPELKPVKSSRFSNVGFDDETFTLFIRFHPTKNEPRGALYSYANFSEEELTDFINAESLGKYFAANLLKNPDHPCTKVAEEAPEASDDEPVYVMQPVPDVPEDEDELKLQALEVATQVKALAIISPGEYLIAGTELVRLRTMRKLAQERVDRIRKPAYEAYQATLELQRDVMKPYDEAEAYLDRGMANYREVERRERLRLEAEENRKRREAAEAEQKRIQAELAEQDAKVAEAQGRPEEAQQIRQQPLPLVPVRVQGVVLPKAVPKVQGIIERAPVWKWRVIASQEHLVPREFLMLNEVAINAAVRTQKNLTSIAGIEVWDEEAKVAVKAAK